MNIWTYILAMNTNIIQKILIDNKNKSHNILYYGKNIVKLTIWFDEIFA